MRERRPAIWTPRRSPSPTALRAIIARIWQQWMLALATSGEGAIPVFLRPRDGNASDQRELAQTVEAVKADVTMALAHF
jgi:hypothetical protein